MRAAPWLAALLPYLALPWLLQRAPDLLAGFAPMAWPAALANAALLVVALGAHALCYAKWHRNAPGRIMANELLTRLWFVLYGFMVVGGAGKPWDLYLFAALLWTALTFLAHVALAQRQGRYDAAANFGLLGVFMVGLVGLQG